ncbi:MAG: phosphonate C-P lyase system protein PhnH [Desulfonatronovibrio sp.]
MDNVLQCQQVFRALMQAMSGPGQVVNPGCSEKNLVQLICETLLDQEVGLAVVGNEVETRMIKEITLSTGCFCTSVKKADYIVVAGGSSDGALRDAFRGSLENPDQGATVIYSITSFKRGSLSLVLKGPGIKDTCTVQMEGVDRSEVEMAAELSSDFPLGLDLIFADQSSLMAIPRSTDFVSIGSDG